MKPLVLWRRNKWNTQDKIENFTLHTVLVYFAFYIITFWPKVTWRGKGWFQLTVYSPWCREAKQELRARFWSRNFRRMLLTGFLPQALSASFLAQLKPTCLGMVPPTESWAFPYWLAIKKMPPPHKLAQRPIWWRQFLNQSSLFPSWVRLINKLGHCNAESSSNR